MRLHDGATAHAHDGSFGIDAYDGCRSATPTRTRKAQEGPFWMPLAALRDRAVPPTTVTLTMAFGIDA
jgi:hypothetical protein